MFYKYVYNNLKNILIKFYSIKYLINYIFFINKEALFFIIDILL